MKGMRITVIVFLLFVCFKEALSDFLSLWSLSLKLERHTEELPIPTFIEIVEFYGYPAEEHKVTTSDGYKLSIHRIPGSPRKPKAPGKPAVYIQHGVLSCSPMFVLGGPDRDLAYMLADSGYDVWIGNARGNPYSRAHVKLSPDHDPEFWEFSYHEIALYDVASTIDYILNETNKKSLVYVGHSMGTTISFVLLSTKPEYNKKIHLVINLATVGNWRKPKNLFKILRDHGELFKAALLATNIREILPQTMLNVRLSSSTCRNGSSSQAVCFRFVQFMSGYNPHLLDTNLYADGFAYFPSGISRKNFFHQHQNLVAGQLQMYDYGSVKNMALYRQLTPPAYNLKNIETPIFMFYGKGDTVASAENSLELEAILKNARAESVPHDEFGHLDFLWAKNIKSLLQDRIIEIIKASPKSARREVEL